MYREIFFGKIHIYYVHRGGVYSANTNVLLKAWKGAVRDMAIWNPWHGCHKISPGCRNCYVYRRDGTFGKDSSIVSRTGAFDLPLKRNRQKEYKLTAEDNPVYTCMTSDFFIEEADGWRPEIWKMIRERKDLHFEIITKRIHRFMDCIPPDWGDGYENVTICSTCEDQERADQRLPVLLSAPIRHREIIHEPMLGEIHIEKYLASGKIEHVTCGGESGENARLLEYAWVLSVREQCVSAGVPFYFKQTGALFRKDGKVYHIPRKDQISQARKAGINFLPQEGLEELFQRLSKSSFRSGFHLKEEDREYVREKGMETMERHARDFIAKRLAPAEIPNDGKQTPMKGHPVFLAQHATGTCCRGCLKKWHRIQPGTELTKEQQDYVVRVLMEWIRREMGKK